MLRCELSSNNTKHSVKVAMTKMMMTGKQATLKPLSSRARVNLWIISDYTVYSMSLTVYGSIENWCRNTKCYTWYWPGPWLTCRSVWMWSEVRTLRSRGPPMLAAPEMGSWFMGLLPFSALQGGVVHQVINGLILEYIYRVDYFNFTYTFKCSSKLHQLSAFIFIHLIGFISQTILTEI